MFRWLLGAAVVLSVASARADKLDTELGKLIKSDHIPGLSIAVVKDGKVVKLGAYGVANVEHQAKVTPATRFEIASMSKAFIATAIRMLADEKKLDLEDPLSKYFDGLPAAWKTMRVRHLVAMSAGFPEDWELIGWSDVREEYDDKSMLAAFTKLKLLSPIGEKFHYSSPSYAMLGMIVTKVTGKPFADFVRERIFVPAGMTESTYNDASTVITARSDGYRWDRETKALKRGFYVAPYMHARADVGIVMTARDLAKWAIALDAGKLIKEPERLFTPFMSDDGKRSLRYGYGWFAVLIAGHRAVLHTGGFRTGFSSLIVRFPDDHLTIATTTNCSGCSDTAVAKLVRTYLKPEAGTAKDPEQDATNKLIAGLRAAGTGKVDAAMFAPGALDAAENLLPALEDVTVEFKARHDLSKRKLQWSGEPLVDYIELLVKLPTEDLILEVYRDAKGTVRDVEITPA